MRAALPVLILTFSMTPAGAFAQDATAGRPDRADAKVTVYYSPATTILKAEAMTFSPRFENPGTYFAVMFEAPLNYRRLGVSGGWLQGTSEDIPGATDFIDSGYDFAFYDTFNPLTDETIHRLTINLTYTVAESPNRTGNLDVTAGYFLLESQPAISKGNTFGGFAIGLAGGNEWLVGGRTLRASSMASYVPTFFVHGNVEGQFTQDYILEYRVGVEYDIAKRLGLTTGYQGMYLKGRVTDQTLGMAEAILGRKVSDAAIVTANGFYFGAYVRLGGR